MSTPTPSDKPLRVLLLGGDGDRRAGDRARVGGGRPCR